MANSSLHPFLDWMKQRIDEMDATVASFEAKAEPKTAQLLAELKKQRADFQAKAATQLAAAEAALKAGKAQLETQWQGFEAQVQGYLKGLDTGTGQQQATFRDIAAAQIKAWRETHDGLQREAARLAAAQRPLVEAALEQMKKQASEAEERLQKLKQTGADSWGALNAALTESRKAFDRASQQAWDAFRKAASG